jgi:hypothetical protein
MSTSRKKPSLAFWATVVMVAVLTYPLSFGPACWTSERTGIGASALSVAYQPILRMWMWHGTYAQSAVTWYAMVGTKNGEYTINRSRVDGRLTIGWYGMR